MISARFPGMPFNITVIQVYDPITDVEEADQFYEDLEDLLEHAESQRIARRDQKPSSMDNTKK